MRKIRAVVRLIKFIGITLSRVSLIIFLEKMTKKSRHRRDVHKMAWARRIVKAMGLEIILKGDIPDSGALIISNHRSYIDIPVLVAYSPLSLLGKAEVRKWPIIGVGAEAVDTLWVKRDSKESRKESLLAVSKMLKNGHPVGIFAEGTTSKAPELKPFKPGTISIAADFGIPIIPVAIEYEDPEDAWVGEETFLPHFMRAFGKKHRRVFVSAGPPITGNNTEELVQRTYDWVDAELKRLRMENNIQV